MRLKSSTNTSRKAEQPELFRASAPGPGDETLVLYALGDFQARGKVLAERELPLDRLRGAMRRAAEVFECPELPDDRFAAVLGDLGAQVRRVPTFVAKHPFRVTVPSELAERARSVHEAQNANS